MKRWSRRRLVTQLKNFRPIINSVDFPIFFDLTKGEETDGFVGFERNLFVWPQEQLEIQVLYAYLIHRLFINTLKTSTGVRMAIVPIDYTMCITLNNEMSVEQNSLYTAILNSAQSAVGSAVIP